MLECGLREGTAYDADTGLFEQTRKNITKTMKGSGTPSVVGHRSGKSGAMFNWPTPAFRQFSAATAAVKRATITAY